MTAEAGHLSGRVYQSQDGAFHLNGAQFFNDAEEDISDSLEVLNGLAPAELAVINGVTAGTGLAEKALVLDASGDVTMPDQGSIGFGGVGKISWDTTDANANKLLIQLPTGGVADVPVIVIGQAVEAVDMAIHNGVTEPTVCVLGTGAVATGPILELRKARGTATAPTVVTSGDDTGALNTYACVAAGEWVQNTQILSECTGTVATTRGPGVLTFKTATDAAPSVLTTALTIGADQSSTFAGNVVMGDAKNIVLNTGTGTKIGTAAGQKLGFFNATPVVQQTLITQTYATASATHADPTATAHTFPGSGNLFDAVANDLLINVRTDSTANAVADIVVNEKSLAENLNQNIADVANVKQVLNTVINYMKTLGFVASA